MKLPLPVDHPQQHSLIAVFHDREAVVVVVTKDGHDRRHRLDRPHADHLLGHHLVCSQVLSARLLRWLLVKQHQSIHVKPGVGTERG